MEKSDGIIYKNRILWHILFWLVIYLFYSITYGGYSEQYKEEFLANFYLLPVRIAGTYAFIYLILPVFLNRKNYALFGFLVVAHALLWGTAIWMVLYFFYYCGGCINPADVPFLYWPKIFGNLISNYAIPAIATAIVLIKRSFKDQLQKQDLEKGKIEAELKFLKSQIHPHFLFNTLNNLYALTLKKSEKAPDMVLRLSEMLDYMLYNSNEKEVLLRDEIKHLHAYLELEKMRYGDRLNLSVNIHGTADGKMIAPLILLPFVENSFKHGASVDIDNSYIDIDIDIQEDCLNFTVSNSYRDEQEKDNYTEGIGLKNVQRRLELIYPEKYSLKIEKKKFIFKIILNICWPETSQTISALKKHEDPVPDSRR